MSKMAKETGKFQFAIDRGGTFTDIWARCPDGHTEVMKLLSEDPANYQDAPREGIRRILQNNTKMTFSKDDPVDTSTIEWIRMGTTIATNALLERKGEKIALVITKGFRDLLHIGNQARPKIFDLEIVCPDVLYDEVVEVEERVVLHSDKCQIKRDCEKATGVTGEQVEIWKKVNRDQLVQDLTAVLKLGITSLAVVLMHSYTFTGHEEEVGKLARELGFTHVSLSHQVMPMVRAVPRGYTACADAYLTPCIQKYVTGFSAGFKDIQNVKVMFMQSDGGLTPVRKFTGSRAILSGPAGGVVGYAMTTYQRESQLPVIGFDMGGTSTDVSRYAGQYDHVFETTTAGVTIQAPQLDINTVAAGGGSQLFFRAGLFVVGPESAGAHPGPVCYKKGGPLAVTDANLVLGRLLPEYFPHIFGEHEDEPLDIDASKQAMLKLTREANEFTASQPDGSEKPPLSLRDVAMGFIKVANESMCRPIRALTQARGHDTSRHVLACFGGAGGQHACAIARSLGMKTVFIHKYAGILSAYGMALADVVHEAQEPCAAIYGPDCFKLIDDRLEVLKNQCVKELQSQGFDRAQIELEPFLHLRYKGTDCAVMCSVEDFPATGATCRHGDFQKAFLQRYEREFGFVIPDREILIDDIRVRGVGKTQINQQHPIQQATVPPTVQTVTNVYFEDGCHETSVYLLENLHAGHDIAGPAIIIDKNSTILVEPNCDATITTNGDIKIKIGSGIVQEVGTELDTIQLSIFSHRFMSTAEQMGRVLQRTSISTNIKERLDFSCALFGPDGGLVANAPHIPVHLGAMQETVQYQMNVLGDRLLEGDVVLSNHPSAGGSHLPDLTVITPVFYRGCKRAVFFVASRGHHADIGGSTPGSMPPHSKSIYEEGAVFKSFFLVKQGVFQEDVLVSALNEPGNYPGCSGTRNLHDNLSDLRAQVAANQKGINLVQDLMDEYGLDVVQAYMAHIQSNAEVAVREMLKEIAARAKEKTGRTQLHAVDFMDDGSRIELSIDINQTDGSAVFDFSGTGPEVHGNCNAPRAVTLSAIIYCLRCMVGHDVPLNQGCLKPVKVLIPKGCLLDPSDSAAVVGGNVLTSQRVTDVFLKAFSVCAASQGCMNNVTMGDSEVGYYETVAGGAGAGCMNVTLFGDSGTAFCETVAGGAGAGPTWDGRSGVHVHMTNTRITDPEILERRYPVVVQCFHLNPHTGGQGRYRGGDGVRRELLFRRPLVLSVLTERRVFAPYGMNGGEPGKVGQNLLLHPDGRVINLGSKTSVDVSTGDVFCLLSPGGGGYGTPESREGEDDTEGPPHKHRRVEPMGGQRYMERGSLYAYRLAQESA